MHFQKPLILTGMLGLLVATTPVVRAQQTARRPPADELRSFFSNAGPEIGISVRDVTSDDGATAPRGGAVVESVRGDSPAAKAGIQAGDVILTYDAESVRSARQLARLIDETPEDRAVSVSVTRDGKRLDLSVTPQSRRPWGDVTEFTRPTPFSNPDLNLLVRPRRGNVLPGIVMPMAGRRLGIQTQELTSQLGQYFGAADGVLVTSVEENTPAQTAGLKAGDVITKIDGQAVDDTAALRRRLASATGTVELTVVRDKKEQTLSVRLTEAK